MWKRRKQEAVIELLSPFMVQELDGDVRLHFHNAVMRWKCSLLGEDEKLKLQAWIDEDLEERLANALEPWRALQSDKVDELTAENQYVQGYVLDFISVTTWLTVVFSAINSLLHAMQTALDEVERVTGMKAILLMGGPIPAQDGNIGTHL